MIMAWIGTTCGIIGSVLVAANTGLQFVGYVSFLIGAFACLYTSIVRKDKAGVTLWGFFSAVNIWGLISYA